MGLASRLPARRNSPKPGTARSASSSRRCGAVARVAASSTVGP
ncbi:hypothetical protein [Rhodospirillum centenum]|nr:hypothetical protein [Rhodospirillum centenum]